jgi:hypothetical protein
MIRILFFHQGYVSYLHMRRPHEEQKESTIVIIFFSYASAVTVSFLHKRVRVLIDQSRKKNRFY